MKKPASLHGMFISVILSAFFSANTSYSDALSLQERINTARSQSSVSALSALVGEVAALRPDDTALYFQLQEELGTGLESLAKTNSAAMQALDKLAKEALNRSCGTNPAVANMCFKSKAQFAMRIARIPTSPPNVFDAQILAKFLGEVRSAMIPGYKRAKVFINVKPPIESGPMAAGMDPRAIADPTARAAYEKAIAENSNRNYTNMLQLYTLPEINRTLTLHFYNYTKELFAQQPDSIELTENLATLAHLTETERSRLRSH